MENLWWVLSAHSRHSMLASGEGLPIPMGLRHWDPRRDVFLCCYPQALRASPAPHPTVFLLRLSLPAFPALVSSWHATSLFSGESVFVGIC